MKTEHFIIHKTDFAPELQYMIPGVIYYDTTSGYSYHLCACGCRDLIMLKHNDKWTLDENTVTISPSIGRMTAPCKSHYFIRNGKTIWC